MFDAGRFAEKYQLAQETYLKESPRSGLCGFEMEWNLLDSQFRPLLTVGSGPGRLSFVDYLRSRFLPDSLRPYSQLEVFHWMIEWATRPYHHIRGAVYESRVMEALLANSLQRAGREFGDRLYYWHGNLLYPARVNYGSIPTSWHLAKRRYLERCVDLYGENLATAGIHTNLSLPDPLLAWDFMHLSPSGRGNMLLDDYKSQVYITGTRLMRAFAALFIATTASTPFQPGFQNERPVVFLTEYDSVRNLTFPNPAVIDQPDLYRSYNDYLNISYDLVRRGVRFGNNNWTPVRARSFAEPVERLILVTSDQLQELYARGLYAIGGQAAVDAGQVESMAHQIEIQNLMARINLPMARVEVRTDDGGGSLELDIANLTLKHLLLLRFYADPDFARSFRYDSEDIRRARRNEEQAARDGMRAEIENPLTAKPVEMRAFLRWTLQEVRPLAEALDLWQDLAPLVEIAAGAPNTAERIRQRIMDELGNGREYPIEAPLELLIELAQERQAQVSREVGAIIEELPDLETEARKLEELAQAGRHEAAANPGSPVRFEAPRPPFMEIHQVDKTAEIIELAEQLIRFPSVTACPQERLGDVRQVVEFACEALRSWGLNVRFFGESKYPALFAEFPGSDGAARGQVLLSGHLDVVAPDPDDRQFEPRAEGDYLWGRGAADMKTVAATDMVWMKDTLRLGPPYPPVQLLLVGNEENGESEPIGTPHALRILAAERGYQPSLLVAGERTGERGDELWGEICTQNRGVMRFDLIVRGQKGHTGAAGKRSDLTGQLIHAREEVSALLQRHLTLSSSDGWQSQISFPFFNVGTPGIYNIAPAEGILGVEVRPIPQDSLKELRGELEAYCQESGLELAVRVMEDGIACNPENPALEKLIQAVRQASGEEPRLGRKLPGTSARFAPGGQGVVWGQSGIGPHAADERHYIPSILPYYQALQAFAKLLM